MLKRLLMAPIKSALAPFFIALSIYRKVKFAFLKLIGGSHKAASAAAGATTTAKDVAADTEDMESQGALQQQDTSHQQYASDISEPSVSTSQEALSQFSRFKRLYLIYTGYSFLLPILALVIVGALEYVSIGNILASSVGTAIVPGIFAAVAHIRKKVTWSVAFGFALIFTLGSFLSFIGLFPSFGIFMGENTGFEQPLLYLLVLGQFGLLGAILRAGWKGRYVVLSSSSEKQSEQPTETTEPSTPQSSASSTQHSVNHHTAPDRTENTSEVNATSSDESPVEDNSAVNTPSEDEIADQVSMETTATSTSQGDEIPEPASSTENIESDAAQSNEAPDSPSLKEKLTDLEHSDVTADDIRELGDNTESVDIPDQMFTVLERHATSDDPTIRLAVCDVCAEIDDERADDILRGRRIDTDDRVMQAAIDGLN